MDKGMDDTQDEGAGFAVWYLCTIYITFLDDITCNGSLICQIHVLQ